MNLHTFLFLFLIFSLFFWVGILVYLYKYHRNEKQLGFSTGWGDYLQTLSWSVLIMLVFSIGISWFLEINFKYSWVILVVYLLLMAVFWMFMYIIIPINYYGHEWKKYKNSLTMSFGLVLLLIFPIPFLMDLYGIPFGNLSIMFLIVVAIYSGIGFSNFAKSMAIKFPETAEYSG